MMQAVWPRCPKCGRRWRAEHAACGTVVAPRESRPSDEALPRLIEGLTNERLLGRGGFGAVYLARRTSDGTKVAVKIPIGDADAIMRLDLEGDALTQLAGAHAPALYDRPTLADDRPCLVMEFIPMPTLADRLHEIENGMPIDELGRRGVSILTALRAVHGFGLVHRDLKPENVFSTDLPPVTRIFDFGLVQPQSNLLRLETTAGTFMGTPEYMSPEQLESSAPVDQRADIYAIGAVLYEMLAGRPPFWGNAAEVQQALANRRAPRPSRYVATAPPAIEDVILRCLAKDPARRFQSTDALLSAFTAALAQSAALSDRPQQPSPPPPATDAKPATESIRRPFAVLAVHGIAVDALKRTLAESGGLLADVGRNGGVAVFGEKTSENPILHAVRLADALLRRKACRAAIVDLVSVAVRRRPDGSERYVSAAFARLQRQVETVERQGLFLTSASSDLVPDRRGEALAAEGLTAALPPPREDDALTVVRTSARPPLIGRTEEMERLLGSVRRCMAERRGSLATVISEGGLGKSHLCSELVDNVRPIAPDVPIVELRVREPIDGEGDGNLRALLGRCYALPPEPPSDRGQALLGDLGPSLWPAAAMALGWMTPEAPELRSLGAAPGVLRATVSRSVGEALRRQARRRPLILVVDDAHFADDTTLEAIEYATMPEAQAPIWVCVAARPRLFQMKPSWGERSGAHVRIELSPLGTEAATELARRFLRPVEHVPATALEILVAGTQGSPFLLSELVRGLKRDGIVRRDGKSGMWFLATDELTRLPDMAATDWLAEREIGALPPELAAHARLSALLGTDFAEDEIDGIMSELDRTHVTGGGAGADPELNLDPHVATRQLLAMGVFKRLRGGRTAFRHTLLRAAVEKGVSERLRTQVHAAAFRYYLSVRGLDDTVRLPRLAMHAAAAGRAAEAAAIYLDLADRARRRHGYVEAESLYSRALGHLDESDARNRMLALRGRGFMRYRMSRHDAVDDLMAARSTARALADPRAEVEIVLEAATALDWIVEYVKSRELVTEAETLLATTATGAETDLLRASLLVGQGRAYWRLSEPARAIEKLRAAIAIAERVGVDAYEARVIALLLLGDLLPYHGRVEEAERVFETVLAVCEQHGDRAHLMVAFLNRRQLWIGRRDLGRALDDSRRSIALAREIGFVTASFMGEYNLGELLYQAGDAEAAWPHVQRAVELEEKQLSGFSRPVARLLEGRLLAFLGRDDEARAVLASISAAQAAAQAAAQVEKLLLPSEQVLLKLIDLCTRAATEDEWRDLRAQADAASVEQELIEVVEMMGLACARHGLTERAHRTLTEAVGLAARIPNVMAQRLARDIAQIPEALRRTAG